MIKRPVSKKNFRRKISEDDEFDNAANKSIANQSNNVSVSVSTTTGSQVNVVKSKSHAAQSASTKVALSFNHDEDEEEDVFVVKKSAQSKNIAKLFRQSKEKTDGKPSASHVKPSANQKSGNNLTSTHKYIPSTSNPTQSLIKSKLSSDIPDAATIHALKKQRELKRQYGSDYVPVDDTVRYQSQESLANKTGETNSRLVREDDNDKSDTEDDYRQLSFSNIKNTNSFPDTTEIDHVDEEDEEVSLWEQEQIRKGSAAMQATPAPSQINQQQNIAANSSVTMPNTIPTTVTMPAQPPTRPTITIETIRLSMKQKLDAAKEVLQTHQRELDRITTYSGESTSNITTLEHGSADACHRFTFFQDIRQYVCDLIECINEKITTIQDCEDTLRSLLKEKAARVVNRRINDIKDEDDEYLGKTVTFQGGIDEYGRDLKLFASNAKQKRKEDRIARQKHRHLNRKGNPLHGCNEDLSTDDELADNDKTRYTMELDKLQQKADQIFEDVIDDFYDIKKIMKQFEKWKISLAESYKDAYIPLCLPKLFSPFVRLQLLQWNIFEPNTTDFEKLPWFEQLMLYGSNSIDSDLDADDVDLLLLPNIVETVVLPKLKWMIEDVWDPLSNKQTQILISLMNRLLEEYPTVSADRKPTQEICSAAVKRMKRCMDDEMYIPLYHKKTFAKFPDALRFANRQLRHSIKLYGNVFRWYGVISTNVLEEIAIDGLLNRYIVLGMRNSSNYQECVKQCCEVVKMLPNGLLQEGSLVQLAVFSRFLVNLADNLNQIRDSKEIAPNTSRQLVAQIKELLKVIKEEGEISKISIPS